MATTETGREEYSEPSVMVQNTMLRRPLFPQIRWGAILAGVAVGISIQLALALLGIATGLSALDVAEGEQPGGTAPLVWAGISMLISAFIGGYVAARMSGFKRKSDGVLHGAVSWGVTTLLFALLASTVAGSLLAGAFNNVMPAAAQTAVQGGSPVISMLQRQLGVNINMATLQRVQRDIQGGRRDDAINTLSSAGIDRDRATTVVDQALIVTGSPERASPQSRAATDEAVGAAGRAAWGVFLAVILSLAVGIGGGVLGVAGSRRTAWATPGVAPV